MAGKDTRKGDRHKDLEARRAYMRNYMRERRAGERSDIGKSSFHLGVTAAAPPRHERQKIDRSAPTEALDLSVFTEALRALGNLFGPGGSEDYGERDAAPTLKSAAAIHHKPPPVPAATAQANPAMGPLHADFVAEHNKAQQRR
jgi:hypothetical protein